MYKVDPISYGSSFLPASDFLATVMGTLDGGLPNPPGFKPLSFKDALVSHAPSTSSSPEPVAPANLPPYSDLGKLALYKGSPAIYYNRQQIT